MEACLALGLQFLPLRLENNCFCFLLAVNYEVLRRRYWEFRLLLMHYSGIIFSRAFEIHYKE